MHARTGLHTHEFSLRSRQAHVYADPYPKNLKMQKQDRILKQQTNNLRTQKKKGTKGLN